MLKSERTIRLQTRYALGDVVVLTAAVRDLHQAYPGVFRTSVQTGAPEVWEHNPYVVEAGGFDRVIHCNKVKLDRSGASRRHYVHAYLDLINEQLGTAARITSIKGDIHISEQEKKWYSDVWSLCGREIPFWLISTGGKYDIPLKWWDHRRYQEVVNALRGKIQFVQVGCWGNYHPALEGVVDLRGKTSVRDLIHLMYYADGVLCGVTSLMHLAAAVPTEHGGERAAVIIGGAREPATWEAYPGHEYISTERAVSCGCCWKSTLGGPLKHRCVTPREALPACMDLISAEEVISRIEMIIAERRTRILGRKDQAFARRAVAEAQKKNTFEQDNLTPENAPARALEFISRISKYPARRFKGRGIVIAGGGVRYFPCAWICIRMLRKLGCKLPIELWHLGGQEMDKEMEDLVRPYGVECVSARKMMDRYPMRNPHGWELKAYSILHSRFKEVLFLDADNVAVRDPSFLFETPEYKENGAIFWPDYGCLAPQRRIWKICDIPYRHEPEFESGQIVVDKERCWRALNLAWWYNDHSEFFYRFVHGDKETFHLAWRKLEQPYAMTQHPLVSLEGTMCQHDFEGNRLFQHRNTPKWVFFGENRRLKGFLYESDCLAFLADLKTKWNARINRRFLTSKRNGWTLRDDTMDEYVYESVAVRNEYRLPSRFEREAVIIDIGAHIGAFALACHERGSRRIVAFEPNEENYRVARKNVKLLSGVKLRRAAVLDRDAEITCGSFPGLNGLENTGGAIVSFGRNGHSTRALAFDKILRQLGQVNLVKLDCEGSEWPILLNGTEWDRVKAICGEYHLFPTVASQLGVREPPSLRILSRVLARHFPSLTIEQANDDGLGRFWAWRERGAFSDTTRRVEVWTSLRA